MPSVGGMEKKHITINDNKLIAFSDGRIYKDSYVSGAGYNINGRWCNSSPKKDGRLKIALKSPVSGKILEYSQARIIAEAFFDAFCENICVGHMDGDLANNCIDNLFLVDKGDHSKMIYEKYKKDLIQSNKLPSTRAKERIVEILPKITEDGMSALRESIEMANYYNGNKAPIPDAERALSALVELLEQVRLLQASY